MRPVALLAAALLATPALAQAPGTGLPGTANTAAVQAGTYKIEPNHTQVIFAIDHMGFSIFRGVLSQASGSLTLDPAAPAKASLSVTVPIASIHTSSDKLNGELVAPDWFDAARFPQASFVSTKVTPGPNAMARVEGNLTIHGVTKPVVMTVRFHGAGADPMSKSPTIGFDGRMSISRSDYKITKYPTLLSDRVEITIAGAFEKVG